MYCKVKYISVAYGILFFILFIKDFPLWAQEQTGVMDILNTTTELSKYTGKAKCILVTDPIQGGLFYLSTVFHVQDDGIVFAGKEAHTFWIRQYDPNNGVDIAWFNEKMDSSIDKRGPLKRALNYAYIKITCRTTLAGNTWLPDGRTIEFTNSGCLIFLDSSTLYVNGNLKANDYLPIFKGPGNVIFSSESVPYVSACWFGANADSKGIEGNGRDNTEAIEKAILASENVSNLYLPPTPSDQYYRITGTLTISKKLHFFSFRFHGGGTTITHKAADKATSIFADFNSGSAINIQGCRRVYISDMYIKGKNTLPGCLSKYGDPHLITDIVQIPDSFLAPGLSKSYIGITTDGDASSNVWSADIVFDNLLIENFYLGLGVSQAGKVQGDRMRVINSQINSCVYGISVGNPQNRSCHFENVDMNRVWCGITNYTFTGGGSEFQVTGGQWCHMYKCFYFQTSFTGQCVISGLYAEDIGSIGATGNAHDNNSSIVFTGCNFMIQDAALHSGNTFKGPFYTYSACANTSFIGCNFWSARHYLAFGASSSTKGFAGAAINMLGCSILKCNSLFIYGNSLINSTYFNPKSDTINYNRSITIDFNANARFNTGYSPEIAISGDESLLATQDNMTSSSKIVRKIPRVFAQVGIRNKFKVLNNYGNDTLVFSYDNNLNATFFRHVLPGDYLGTPLDKLNFKTPDYNPTIKVFAIDTLKNIVKAFYYTDDFILSDLSLLTNSFFTTKPIFGKITSGSNKITEIQNVNLLAVGDFFTFHEAKHAYRIRSLDFKENSAILTEPINVPFNGKTKLYNELLMPND